MMPRPPRTLVLAGLALLWIAVAPRGALATEPIRIQNLAVAQEGEGLYRVSLDASGPLGACRCRLDPDSGTPSLVVEFPHAGFALKPSYEFPGMPENTIRASVSAAGVRIQIPLKGMSFLGWESGERTLTLHLGAAAFSSRVASESVYRLGRGDKLTLSVFGHDDMHQDLEIQPDGTVVLPLLGVLEVAGKTVAEVRSEVETKLKEYLVKPQVSLDVKEYRSQPVNVVGEVKSPGQYYLKGPTTVVDIIALAGWLTQDAGSEITITRHENVPSKGIQVRQILVNKEDLVGGGQKHDNPLVRSGDVVTVGSKQYFYIRGEVSKPGQYTLEDHPTLMKAISIAQGLTPYARKKGIELIRMVGGVQTKKVVDLKAIEEHKIEDIPLKADDQILVPRRRF